MLKPLPTAPTDERNPGDGDHPVGWAVESAVLAGLGHPPSLYRVAVRPLWKNHFRVNVLVGSDPTTVRIAHSYFVQTGLSGDVLSTAPRITRLYT